MKTSIKCDTEDISTYVEKQQINYLVHLATQPNTTTTKKLLFNDNKIIKRGRPSETLEEKVMKSTNLTKDQFYKNALLSRIGYDHPHGFDRRQSSKR